MIVSVLSARPAPGRVRSTKVALKGSVLSAVNGSGCWPLMRSSKRERKRVSRKKRPWGRSGSTSPDREEMQNDEPWTRVTVPEGPPSEGLSPSKVHGSDICATLLRRSARSRVFPYGRSANRMGVVSAPLFEVAGLRVSVEGHEILKGVDLTVEPGRIHALMGPNGSGKSTLANALLANPDYEVTAGRVRFKGSDITDWPTDVRGKAGLFLAFQYPEELPGVS